jgi:acetyl-CoA synthetase
MLRRTGADVGFVEGRDVDWASAAAQQSADCPPEEMNAEDPMFILYTSGSTGKPKGVLHTTGGYMVYVSMTHQYVFDYHDGDDLLVHGGCRLGNGTQLHCLWSADANGAITLMFEGVPTYPRCQPVLAGDRQA